MSLLMSLQISTSMQLKRIDKYVDQKYDIMPIFDEILHRSNIGNTEVMEKNVERKI